MDKNREKKLKHDREYSKLYRERNPEKIAKYRNSYKEKPEQRKKYNLKKRYNITLKDFNILYKKQYGKCKICEIDYPKDKLCIDHNHISNKIRGLLCQTCNRGLGQFKDDIKLFKKAIEYLSQ